ncbi:MAG: HD domain-containing protein [Chloroflexi bacterium]|nr:HD domain-containing protein [Chloroflexota bacterium]
MLRVSVQRLRPGTMLARTLYDAKGNVLLRANVPLTAGYIESLVHRGFPAVYIRDRDTDDVDIPELVSQQVRVEAHATVQQVFTVARQAITEAIGGKEKPTDHKGNGPSENGQKSKEQFQQIENIVKEILRELVSSNMLSGIAEIRSYDDRTFSHSIEVAVTAIMIGKRLYMSESDLIKLGSGCMLHDIGKLFIEQDIYKREDVLSTQEYRRLRGHTVLGYKFLRNRNPNNVLANHVAFQHHERQDGKGYPRGLRGTNTYRRRRSRKTEQYILPFAEIAAVADVHDMLSSDRPEKPSLAPQQIATIMREMSGTLLNAEIVQHFLSILPMFPVGIGIAVQNGFYRGYRGIVVRSNRRYPDRPIIRLLYDEAHERVAPVELDLSYEADIQIITIQEP